MSDVASVLEFLWKWLPTLLFGFPGDRPGGLTLSVLIAGVAIALGFGLALAVGAGRVAPWRGVRRLAGVYVEIFRGLPLLLLLLLVHQFIGGRRFGLDFSPLTSTLIALTLYTSAYQAEIVRAGLEAVPRELTDSARLMGADRWQVFFRVRLRYTVRAMLPAFTGQAISLFKDSSVVLVLGVGELMTVARSVLGSDIRNSVYWVPIYLTVGVLYAAVALIVSRLADRWERRSRLADQLTYLSNV
ncbi:MAG: putative glutamine ABC transporter permease protein GlnP [Anaerolineales bacterium]|nr:putative glutamine ABC transporter permease protein GlnP [Anaerolineales bacterium]